MRILSLPSSSTQPLKQKGFTIITETAFDALRKKIKKGTGCFLAQKNTVRNSKVGFEKSNLNKHGGVDKSYLYT